MEGKELQQASLAAILVLLGASAAQAQTPTGLASLPQATSVNDSDTMALCQKGPASTSCTLNSFIWSRVSAAQIATYITQRTQSWANQTISASANTLLNIPSSALNPTGVTSGSYGPCVSGAINTAGQWTFASNVACGSGGAGSNVSVTSITPNTLAVNPSPGTGVFTLGTQITTLNCTITGALACPGNVLGSGLSGDIIYVAGGSGYTLAQAGSVGFVSGYGICLINNSLSGAATVATTASLFYGAGNTTLLTIQPQSWACLASDGTNYATEGASSSGVIIGSPVSTGAIASWSSPTTITGNLFRAGNSSTISTLSGAALVGDTVVFDASGNIKDAGGAPGLTNAQNYWPLQQSSSECAITGLTTITPSLSGCGVVHITLVSGSNTLINFPTGLVSGTTQTNMKMLDFLQPASGPVAGVTFVTGVGYYLPNAGAQPILTPINGVADEVSCQIFGGTTTSITGLAARCSNNGLSNFRPASVVTFVKAASGLGLPGICGSPCTTSGVITGVTSGAFIIAKPFACNDGGCGNTSAPGPSSITDTLSTVYIPASGAFAPGGASGGVQLANFSGIATASGTDVVTVTWPGSGTIYYGNLYIELFTLPPWMTGIDAGLGNTSFATGGASLAAVSTKGPLTLNGQLVDGMCNAANFSAVTTGTLAISGIQAFNTYALYSLPSITTVQSLGFTKSATGTFSCDIAVFQ